MSQAPTARRPDRALGRGARTPCGWQGPDRRGSPTPGAWGHKAGLGRRSRAIRGSSPGRPAGPSRSPPAGLGSLLTRADTRQRLAGGRPDELPSPARHVRDQKPQQPSAQRPADPEPPAEEAAVLPPPGTDGHSVCPLRLGDPHRQCRGAWPLLHHRHPAAPRACDLSPADGRLGALQLEAHRSCCQERTRVRAGAP